MFIKLEAWTIIMTLFKTLIYGGIMFLICNYAFKKSKKHTSNEQVSANDSDNEQRWD